MAAAADHRSFAEARIHHCRPCLWVSWSAVMCLLCSNHSYHSVYFYRDICY
jgi:hypothetical protein